MFHKRVLRRLYYLRNFELLNIFLLPFALLLVLITKNVSDWLPYLYGIMVVCAILAEGALYWHLKIASLRHSPRQFPSWFRPTYRRLWWINAFLLAGYWVYVAGAYNSGQLANGITIWPHLLWSFALLEHINYFHYQLSHDNLEDLKYLFRFRRLRKSPLKEDLDRQEARALV